MESAKRRSRTRNMKAMAKSPLNAVLTGLLLASALLGGCSWFTPPAQRQTAKDAPGKAANAVLTDPARLKSRPAVNTTRNLYEGSLWRGAASWGNLMRDHRARYVGDLLTVSKMADIIKVPEQKKAEPLAAQQAAQQAQQAPEKPNPKIDPVLAFLQEQQKRREQIEAEQNEILRSVENVEVEVIRVLPNGNLIVRGLHPPIFRDGNRVRYLLTLRGIVRPSDVDDNNTITSSKLSKAEYKIQRQVQTQSLPLGAVARAANKPKEGALFDRLTDLATSQGPNRTTQVQTQ
jgi:flagellar basal body L-ring protein FlgH